MVLFTIYVYSFDIPEDNIQIIARQQNYWGIASDKVINTFKMRQSKKNGRIEVEGFRKILYIINNEGEKEAFRVSNKAQEPQAKKRVKGRAAEAGRSARNYVSIDVQTKNKLNPCD